jgi:hypothetical protein
MNYMDILVKYELKTYSVVGAVSSFGDRVRTSSNQLVFCNKFLKELGCSSFENRVDAEIAAKAAIERLLMQQDEFDVKDAMSHADNRIKQLRERMPELWATSEIEEVIDGKVKKTNIKKGRKSDVKDKAKVIYEANKQRDKKDIIILMSKELGITKANASYYVSRVFS